MDVGDHTTAGDGGFDEGVELLVTADSQLEVAGGDALDLKVFAGVTSQLEDLSGEVLKDSRRVDSGSSANAAARIDSSLQDSVDPAHGELEPSAGRS